MNQTLSLAILLIITLNFVINNKYFSRGNS